MTHLAAFLWNHIKLSDRVALLFVGIAAARSVVLWRRGRVSEARLAWSIGLVAVTLPLLDFSPHASWQRVGWIPFDTPPVKRTDIVANTLLYVPFGFLSFRGAATSGALLKTARNGLALAVLLESTQLFSQTRFPSTTDALCNAAGAALGFALAWLVSSF